MRRIRAWKKEIKFTGIYQGGKDLRLKIYKGTNEKFKRASRKNRRTDWHKILTSSADLLWNIFLGSVAYNNVLRRAKQNNNRRNWIRPSLFIINEFNKSFSCIYSRDAWLLHCCCKRKEELFNLIMNRLCTLLIFPPPRDARYIFASVRGWNGGALAQHNRYESQCNEISFHRNISIGKVTVVVLSRALCGRLYIVEITVDYIIAPFDLEI